MIYCPLESINIERSRIAREIRQEPVIRKCISDLEEKLSQRRKKLDRKIEATLNELLQR